MSSPGEQPDENTPHYRSHKFPSGFAAALPRFSGGNIKTFLYELEVVAHGFSVDVQRVVPMVPARCDNPDVGRWILKHIQQYSRITFAELSSALIAKYRGHLDVLVAEQYLKSLRQGSDKVSAFADKFRVALEDAEKGGDTQDSCILFSSALRPSLGAKLMDWLAARVADSQAAMGNPYQLEQWVAIATTFEGNESLFPSLRGAPMSAGGSQRSYSGSGIAASSRCHKCGKSGHFATRCPVIQVAAATRLTDDQLAEKRVADRAFFKTAEGASKLAQITCYECGKKGHLKWMTEMCPGAASEGAPIPVVAAVTFDDEDALVEAEDWYAQAENDMLCEVFEADE